MTASPSSSGAPLRVAIAGASGRMGRMLIEAVIASPDLQLTGALDAVGNPGIGTDAGAFLGQHTGVPITGDLAQGLANAQVLIDFTRPEGTLAHLAAAADQGVGVVIGTTGFSDAQKGQIADFARRTAVVFSPNMSVGVNVTFKLLAMAAKALQQGGYDIEIIEAHHKHKVDAPSGTALKMGEVIAEAQGTQLAERAVYERYGHTGARAGGSIGFATVRGGDVVGEHTVLFIGDGERIEIAHKSNSRAGYATGSLRAARYLAQQQTGLFDMDDVLGLK